MTGRQRRLLEWATLTPCGWLASLAAGAVAWVIAPVACAVLVPTALVVSAIGDARGSSPRR